MSLLTGKCSFALPWSSFLDLRRTHSLPGVTWTSVTLKSYSSILWSFDDGMGYYFDTPSIELVTDLQTFYQSQELSLIGQTLTDFECSCSYFGLHLIRLLA